MAKVRYSATFTLPNGETHVLTRGSKQEYGYTVAWILLAGKNDWKPAGEIVASGFSRDRRLAESAVRSGLTGSRVALFAPVINGGKS